MYECMYTSLSVAIPHLKQTAETNGAGLCLSLSNVFAHPCPCDRYLIIPTTGNPFPSTTHPRSPQAPLL